MSKRRGRKKPVVFVADVGGTNARLALYEIGGRAPIASTTGESRAYESLEAVAAPFIAEAGVSPAAGVVGIAGPVRGRRATVTNLSWRLDADALGRRLGIPRLILVNDLVVAARGCLRLGPSHLELLGKKRPATTGENLAVIAAGTGLGEARLVWDGARHIALGTEGGHCDFAPRSPLEIELWHFLHGRFPDHVSYERVVCGSGLGALYDFFASRAGREPRAVARRLADGDRNAAIADLGLTRGSRPATRAVALFASVYGAEAGNLALRELAVGGIFVVGNIGRSIVPHHRDAFLEGFCKKGRFSSMMADIPVAVVTETHVGLLGALAIAEELCG